MQLIKPGLRRVWRESGSLQIGLSRRRGTVITGLGPVDIRLLEALGDVPAPDTARARELLELLSAADVLARCSGGPPEGLNPDLADRAEADRQVWSVVHGGREDGWPVLAARASYRVIVCGRGRVARLLADTLLEAGVGRVVIAPGVVQGLDGPGGIHVAPPAAPGRASPAGPAGVTEPPDLAVLVDHEVADAEAADRLVSADIPHLSVVVREDDVVVGPLVRPGRGPCLRCLDLHRSERDPAWPSMLAQLAVAGPARPEETASSQLAAGLAALQVLGQLDGVREPAAAGATLEIELPHGLVARRTWPAHPACGCHWPPGDAGERSGSVPGRMAW